VSRDRAWALAKSQTRYNLTTYRKLQARDFGSVATIVTTDFEALYAYEHGDYQRCLQLSTQNARTLLNARRMPDVLTIMMFVPLFDDEIVSLIALTLIVDRECRAVSVDDVRISQLTLSLYLVAKCQLVLRHSVMSMITTFDCIEIARRRLPADRCLDHLTLKMTKRNIMNWAHRFICISLVVRIGLA